jgi:pseudouridine-5'-phosphate glycosidase
MNLLRRAGPRAVALETTLLLHGVPPGQGAPLARDLADAVRASGGEPAIVGVLRGTPIVGMTDQELDALFAAGDVPKANTANLGPLLHARSNAATTVSTTMELAAAAGVMLFATGGLGGVHKGYATRPDISADLTALARFPVAVVACGVKSILDVAATREALETLGVPVVGFRTDRFPAFYQRDGGETVDASFDDPADLARFLKSELARTGRGVLVANPIPEPDEIDPPRFAAWLAQAEREAGAAGATGRAATPFILSRLHALSGGATLRANIALVLDNARLAGRIAAAW